MTKIRGNKIWLTGASSGIGEALVYELNKLGAELIISARRASELERVKQASRSPQNIQILPLDLSDLDSLSEKVKEAIQLSGKIDVMIHNGGISQRSLARETALEVDRRLMDVNFFGTVALTKALLPHMLKRKERHFVIISSLVGKFGTPYRSSYAASKHALHGFFDTLRAEEGTNGIRISIVCPGFIHTNISVNALIGDGTKLNQMDEAQAKGMHPEKCATAIVKAIKNNKDEIYVGGKEVAGVYIKRFFPQIFNKLIGKTKVR